MLHRRAVPTLILVTALLPGLASAQSKTEEEASRQLEFARTELQDGNYEKALTSSDSAIRLNPALYDAYIYRALAYEGLGDNKVAEGLLITYLEVNPVDPAAAPAEIHGDAVSALERVQGKLGEPGGWGRANDAVASADSGGGAGGLAAPADMPEFPLGSEEFLEWMVARQQWDAYETRTQAGAGLSVGGLALAGIGGALVGVMAVTSVQNPNDANVEALYAAGIASLFAGGTMAGVGLPMLVVNAPRLGRMKKAAAAKAAALGHVQLGPGGLAFRF